ncbi:hypothetical protein AHAS_Ahas02G0092900 [Arachis hypogaea]
MQLQDAGAGRTWDDARSMKEKPRDFGMSSTSATRTRNKTRIIKCGALPVLLNHLHSQSQTVVQLTVAAMLTLSSCKANKVAIASSGALQHLAEFAIGLLENIVSSSESALCEAASVGGAIRILVETIEDGSSLGKEHAVGILFLICQSCREKYRGMILREGGMPGLHQLSIDGTRRAKNMARELLLLLRDYSDYSSRQTQIIMSS